MALCDILSHNPPLLEPWAPQLAQRLTALTDSIIPFTQHSVARSIAFLSRAAPSPELADTFSLCLRRMMERTADPLTLDHALDFGRRRRDGRKRLRGALESEEAVAELFDAPVESVELVEGSARGVGGGRGGRRRPA